jgi:glutathione S-transferase
LSELTLYFHPLSSFCMKALIALYENDTPFEPCLTNLFDETARAKLVELWPIGKFPVLRDEGRRRTVPEASIIIEYLAAYYPGGTELVPADPDLARETRLRDRFYDLYVNEQMQKIVGDRLRPADSKDPYGVDDTRRRLKTAIEMTDKDMAGRNWAMGDAFTMADCAAAPALFYADKVMPFEGSYPNAAAYLGRLAQRPSFARVLEEAQPYFKMFPG